MAATPNPPICSTTMSILSAHLEIQQHGEIKRDAIGITNGMRMCGGWSNANRVPTGHNAYDSMSCHSICFYTKSNNAQHYGVNYMSSSGNMAAWGIRRDAMGIIKARPMGCTFVECGQMQEGC